MLILAIRVCPLTVPLSSASAQPISGCWHFSANTLACAKKTAESTRRLLPRASAEGDPSEEKAENARPKSTPRNTFADMCASRGGKDSAAGRASGRGKEKRPTWKTEIHAYFVLSFCNPSINFNQIRKREKGKMKSENASSFLSQMGPRNPRVRN